MHKSAFIEKPKPAANRNRPFNHLTPPIEFALQLPLAFAGFKP